MKAVLNLVRQYLFLTNIFLSVTFSLSLVVVRVLTTRELSFIFLMWNLLLAIIPYLISEFLLRMKRGESRLLKGIFLAVCIGFLPNAPYMLTDLFHLRHHQGSLLWFDSLLIVSFAWNGLLFFFHTMLNIDRLLLRSLGPWLAGLIKLALIFMCSFGIYIGRFLRFNSWDVVSNPFVLFTEIIQRISHPVQHPLAWGMTIVYTGFLCMAYLGFLSFPGREPKVGPRV